LGFLVIRRKNFIIGKSWRKAKKPGRTSTPKWKGCKPHCGTRDDTEGLRDRSHPAQTEEKYRSIFEEAIEGVFQTSVDGRFLSANPSLAHVHGYASPQELIDSITDISKQLYVNPEDRARSMEKMNREGALRNFETQMYSKDGSITGSP